jgi:hypothetical protein
VNCEWCTLRHVLRAENCVWQTIRKHLKNDINYFLRSMHLDICYKSRSVLGRIYSKTSRRNSSWSWSHYLYRLMSFVDDKPSYSTFSTDCHAANSSRALTAMHARRSQLFVQYTQVYLRIPEQHINKSTVHVLNSSSQKMQHVNCRPMSATCQRSYAQRVICIWHHAVL